MQNAAAMSTASWISMSVAPGRARALDIGRRHLLAALLNLAAMASSAFSLGDTGAVWKSRFTASTRS